MISLVHELTPYDIKVVSALGDSITVSNDTYNAECSYTFHRLHMVPKQVKIGLKL